MHGRNVQVFVHAYYCMYYSDLICCPTHNAKKPSQLKTPMMILQINSTASTRFFSDIIKMQYAIVSNEPAKYIFKSIDML